MSAMTPEEVITVANDTELAQMYIAALDAVNEANAEYSAIWWELQRRGKA